MVQPALSSSPVPVEFGTPNSMLAHTNKDDNAARTLQIVLGDKGRSTLDNFRSVLCGLISPKLGFVEMSVQTGLRKQI